MNRNLCLLLLVTALTAVGCTMAPKYARPEAPVPAEWPTGAAYPSNAVASTASDASLLAWREVLPDERLQEVMEVALKNNRDVRLAVLNVERARALYGIQRAELLPRVDAVGSGSKQGVPADLSSTGIRQTSERYDANLEVAAWELDFFGRIRNLKARALEQYLASEEARRSAQILLVSSVANAYMTLAAEHENLSLSHSTLDMQQGSYDLIKRLFDLGLAPQIDLLRAQTQVDATRGDVARFTQAIALDLNALNLLVGSSVNPELVPLSLSALSPPRDISPRISSEVLLRRPDVLQAEHGLKAAHADIGAARAALFPSISLTAAFGTASSELSGLFASGSDAWNYAPKISLAIFDARAWSALTGTKVQREIALTQYEKAIQTAFREVADSLAVRGTVDEQVLAQESLVKAVTETLRLSQLRYDRGIDGYLGVLDAQRSLRLAQQVLVSLRLQKSVNLVRLYAVLGGGGELSDAQSVE